MMRTNTQIQNPKKIVVFDATGTIGKAVVAALSPKYDVLQVGNRQGQFKADLAEADSIRNVFEAPRGVRVNVVSPPWVTETLKALNMDPSPGKTAVEVAKGYVKSIEGQQSGEVIEV
jgi:nucleoside-diphosphate-sugar epimerase